MQQPELSHYYAIADIFVLPSLSEPWGVVVNEAMASGLPIIATEMVGAVGDIVENGINGYVVPAGNPEALYEAMKRLIENEGLRKEMSEQSRRIIKSWTHKQAVEGFLSAITDAVWQRRKKCA